MNRVCIFLATGFEEIEALTVVDLLRRAGIDTEMVSVQDELEVTSSHNITVKADKFIKEIDFKSVTMIVLPGGMPGTDNLEKCELLMQQVEYFYHNHKLLSAICAAPRILGKRGMLIGRNACSFPDAEQYLEGSDITKNEVELSEHIITARGMGCSIAFALAIVERLQGKEASENLGKKIIYKQ